MTYRGCQITKFKGGFVWEEALYGAESDDVFLTVDAAKADIARYFGNEPALIEIDGEIQAGPQ